MLPELTTTTAQNEEPKPEEPSEKDVSILTAGDPGFDIEKFQLKSENEAL